MTEHNFAYCSNFLFNNNLGYQIQYFGHEYCYYYNLGGMKKQV